jgi:hypothetical protein
MKKLHFFTLAVVMFIFVQTFSAASDDFEDGVIDGSKWIYGGEKRGYDGSPSGSWQWSHQEITDSSDGYLRAHVWGPYTGNTYGAEAWIRTTQNFNDGGNYVINFTWKPDFADTHHNQYRVQITDGYIPAGVPFHWQDDEMVGTTNLLWQQTQTGDWVNNWYYENQTTPGKLKMSLEILPTGIARLYNAPDKDGSLLREESLDLTKDWYFRLMINDGTSAGFGAGDAWFDIYDVKVVPEPATLLLFGLGGLILRRRKA